VTGRRWKFLIGRFKARATEVNTSSGHAVVDDSTGDDESDDEDDEDGRCQAALFVSYSQGLLSGAIVTLCCHVHVNRNVGSQ
jgi:hypothetical protein